MRIIQKANEDIVKIWDEGKIRQTVYRLLTYIIPVETDDGTLLHNVITGEMIFLDKEEMQKLSALPFDYAPWMDELIKRHYLVQEDNNDMKSADNIRTALRMIGGSKKISSYVIAPTTNCNARCFYCYEHGVKHENMTDETADRLVDFIESHHGEKEVRITWFGGEPLVGIRQIDRICKALKDKSIDFKSRMISNGYLFDKETVERIKNDWHITDIQITLDGTEKVYNEVKAYINPCENPYQRVLQNIEHLIDNGIKVNIRLNLGFHNAEDLVSLADELIERFKGRDNLYAYVAMLYDDCGSNPFSLSEEEIARLHEMWKPLSAKVSVLGVRSMKITLPQLTAVQCMADGDDCVLITPSGKIGKCEHYIKDRFVGDIENGITDTAELKSYRERKVYPHCKDCVLYPSCVRLKMCPSKRDCISLRTNAIIEGTKDNMKALYEEYLREDIIKTDSKNFCRKGEMYEKI